jgi:protein-tyrosine phosphatase
VSERRTGVLFVCLGNICRSPLAKGIFVHLAGRAGVLHRFDVDSCGTGDWHIGCDADPRTLEVARRYGIDLPHVARQLDPERDFLRFHYLIAMDRANMASLLSAGAPRERVYLMRSFDSSQKSEAKPRLDVPDPFYGPGDGFHSMYQMLTAACEGLLDKLVSGEDAALRSEA